MEGTLSVQLLAMQKIKVGKRVGWSGPVQVVLQCETFGDSVRTYTLPRLHVTGGHATFQSARGPASTDTREENISDFVFRKVPMSGVLTLTLRKISPFGLKTMAKAYLHLDQALHQEDGGRNMEHTLKWHSVSGSNNSMGSITIYAFWMSTEQECLEMELMTVQVCQSNSLSALLITKIQCLVLWHEPVVMMVAITVYPRYEFCSCMFRQSYRRSTSFLHSWKRDMARI
jgi:hypothetical protein